LKLWRGDHFFEGKVIG